MSATITTDIFCDKCGDWTSGDSGMMPRRLEARKIAKTRGWTYERCRSPRTGGKAKDLCPMCNGNADYKFNDGSYRFVKEIT